MQKSRWMRGSNALCHKDYSTGIPIQISVYDDRLYIGNCGQLPENWTVENLMTKHASKPFNPYIAHVYYLAGFIESWGRGIEKICNACREDGVPQPEYTVHLGDIMVKFTAPPDRVISSGKRVTEKVTEKETVVLSLLIEDPNYTTKELAEKLSLSRKTISERIKSLKNSGMIRRIGSDTKGHWEIIEDGK